MAFLSQITSQIKDHPIETLIGALVVSLIVLVTRELRSSARKRSRQISGQVMDINLMRRMVIAKKG